MIAWLDVAAIIQVGRNAVANVSQKIKILEPRVCDSRIGKRVQLAEGRLGRHELPHLGVKLS
jgi:hypothetical protein